MNTPLTFSCSLFKLGYTFGIYVARQAKMERASIFKSNKSQALRLPKPVAYPDDVKQVDIVVIGRARIITPAGEAWDSWFDGEGVSGDFMTSREQPAPQERETL